MGAMDRMRERMEEMERQEEQKRRKELEESRQRYRPEMDSLPIRKARWLYGAYTLGVWAAFIGLSFINNAGFWAQYVLFLYLALSAPLLLYTRGWIQMLFLEEGELSVKAYRRSIGQCKGSLIGLALLWLAVAVAEIIFLTIQRPADTAREIGFLVGCLAAALGSCIFRTYAKRVNYTLWNLDDPVLGKDI
ncbi:MAG: hypothetical protein IJ461_01715 [Clostridia bacterium]|nr:hypothetical protein [Clostridia bacterium]